MLFNLILFIFITAASFHLIRKNRYLLVLFIIQSGVVALILSFLSFSENEASLLFAAFLALLVKAIVAPYFLFGLIRRHEVKTAGSTYLRLPITLLIILILTILAFSPVFAPLGILSRIQVELFPLTLASVLVSLFLIINRKGALSQIIGVLSLENSIVALAAVIGVHQTVEIEIGIMFVLLVWIIIATVFMAMVHTQFGSLDDVTIMKHLKE